MSAFELAVCAGQVEVYLYLSISSLSPDSLQWHLGKEGIWQCGFDEA